jgi:hypothetical protein
MVDNKQNTSTMRSTKSVQLLSRSRSLLLSANLGSSKNARNTMTLVWRPNMPTTRLTLLGHNRFSQKDANNKDKGQWVDEEIEIAFRRWAWYDNGNGTATTTSVSKRKKRGKLTQQLKNVISRPNPIKNLPTTKRGYRSGEFAIHCTRAQIVA